MNHEYNTSDSHIDVQPSPTLSSPTSPTLESRLPGNTSKPSEEQYSVSETFRLSCMFSIIWFLSNYFQNASLSLTNVSSSTILSSTSGLFTLIFGVLARTEKFNYIKCAGVLVSLFGVIFVSTADHNSSDDMGNSPILGDLLSLCGSILYGFYTVLLKKKIPNEDRVDPMLFFGFVGLINTICLIPLFPVCHLLGIESFGFSEFDSDVWKILLINAFVGSFISDCLWLYAVILTSAVLVTVGLSLTIPFALIGDIFFKGTEANSHHFIGATLVIIGFLFVNLEKQIQKVFKQSQSK
jgi:solute carrier family 35 protein F5